MSPEVRICCGSGGVGKTTVSAALALRLAQEGRRVAVLTIDPARRLADSLGMGPISNEGRGIPVPGGGRLDAMMLDAQGTFDALVRRHAPDAATAARILQNRYYRFAAARLGGSHEYMAMERLLELFESGDYDVIVLDTPPTRHALDFLRAPERMSGLMDDGVLRWITMPASRGGWRALEMGSELVTRVLQRLVGQGTVGEIAEFFDAFRHLADGMGSRSRRVRALLGAPQTRFLLISSPAPEARAEALYFLEVLGAQGLPFGGFLVNRVATAPPALPVDPPAAWPAGAGPLWRALHRLADEQAGLAAAHAEAIDALRAAGPRGAPCWTMPEQAEPLTDLEALLRFAGRLPAPDELR